jgi:8-amino-7-oxononanoate synthase
VKPRFIQKLDERKSLGSIRSLSLFNGLVDFCSNDYLGLSKNETISSIHAGSTGSRLISGNSENAEIAEKYLARIFQAEASLIYNSGYDANIGFFSAVPQRNETVFYDELIHASVRDGIRLSLAKNYSFKHNDLFDLESKLAKIDGVKFIAIESLYSMDGDLAPIADILRLCKKYNAFLIVDEAHAVGVLGENGLGLSFEYCNHPNVFARVITFGKAIGTHGAAVLGSSVLIEYLINFSRSFIYTTALPPKQYTYIQEKIKQSIDNHKRNVLHEKIKLFRNKIKIKTISAETSPIQIIPCPGIEHVKAFSQKIQNAGFAVKAILSPTVPEGKERIRICIHAFNTDEEIVKLCELLNA